MTAAPSRLPSPSSVCWTSAEPSVDANTESRLPPSPPAPLASMLVMGPNRPNCSSSWVSCWLRTWSGTPCSSPPKLGPWAKPSTCTSAVVASALAVATSGSPTSSMRSSGGTVPSWPAARVSVTPARSRSSNPPTVIPSVSSSCFRLSEPGSSTREVGWLTSSVANEPAPPDVRSSVGSWSPGDVGPPPPSVACTPVASANSELAKKPHSLRVTSEGSASVGSTVSPPPEAATISPQMASVVVVSSVMHAVTRSSAGEAGPA